MNLLAMRELLSLAIFLGFVSLGCQTEKKAKTEATEPPTSEGAMDPATESASSGDQPGTVAHDAPEADSASQSWSGRGVSPQAQPVHEFLAAIVKSDVEAFRSTFTSQLRPEMDEYGPEKVMKIWQGELADVFGTHILDPSRVNYEFEPRGEDKGGVVISHQGQQAQSISVKKTDEGWKINMK